MTFERHPAGFAGEAEFEQRGEEEGPTGDIGMHREVVEEGLLPGNGHWLCVGYELDYEE